ncbi:MAG: DUF1524 domain-containing protein [Cellulomonadaceae bacterium]|nr:DUF1524 domain-containing protein [Cellulomonadaceae bacterium]
MKTSRLATSPTFVAHRGAVVQRGALSRRDALARRGALARRIGIAVTASALVMAGLPLSASATPGMSAGGMSTSVIASERAGSTVNHAGLSAKKIAIKKGKAKITGTAKFGSTLTAKASGFTASPKPKGLKYTYTWYRGSTKITATSTTAKSVKYTLAAADVGKVITVKVKAVATGSTKAKYTAQTVTSAGTAKVAAIQLSAGTVKLSGDIRVNSKVTASAAGFSATPKPAGILYTYTWMANGTKVSAVNSTATSTTFVPKTGTEGKKLTVSVLAAATGVTKAGFTTRTVTSAATAGVGTAPGAGAAPAVTPTDPPAPLPSTPTTTPDGTQPSTPTTPVNPPTGKPTEPQAIPVPVDDFITPAVACNPTNAASGTTPRSTSVNVLSNDTNASGLTPILTVPSTDAGSWTINGDATVTFTPAPGYYGNATNSYTLPGAQTSANITAPVSGDDATCSPLVAVGMVRSGDPISQTTGTGTTANVSTGSGRNAPVNAAFANPLQVTVTNEDQDGAGVAAGKPVPGVLVTFTTSSTGSSPSTTLTESATGATVTLSATTATTDENGVAQVFATAGPKATASAITVYATFKDPATGKASASTNHNRVTFGLTITDCESSVPTLPPIQIVDPVTALGYVDQLIASPMLPNYVRDQVPISDGGVRNGQWPDWHNDSNNDGVWDNGGFTASTRVFPGVSGDSTVFSANSSGIFGYDPGKTTPGSATTAYWFTGNGRNDRDDILARDIQSVVNLVPSADPYTNCSVQSGTYLEPYGGTRVTFQRGDLNIEHMVALGNAWLSGSGNWNDQQMHAFATDPLELVPADNTLNNVKSSMSTDQWIPPYKDYVCTYVTRQVMLKYKYNLGVTDAERSAMKAVLSNVGTTTITPKTDSSSKATDYSGGIPANLCNRDTSVYWWDMSNAGGYDTTAHDLGWGMLK